MGDIKRFSGLPARLRQFAVLVSQGVTPMDAAQRVGISEADAARFCADALQHPLVTRYIQEAQHTHLVRTILPDAINDLHRQIKSPSVAETVKTRASALILEYGFKGYTFGEEPGGSETEQTVEQLEERAKRIRAELEARMAKAKILNPKVEDQFE